jgi:hypothetical protein
VQQHCCQLSVGPLSLIPVCCEEARGSVKDGGFCRRSESLTEALASIEWNIQGKGAGGLRGLVPWRSMRQRLMRAPARRRPRRRLPSQFFQFCCATLLDAKTIGPTPSPPVPSAVAPPGFHTHSRHPRWAACRIRFVLWAGGCYLSDGLLRRPRRGTQSPRYAAIAAVLPGVSGQTRALSSAV